MTLYQLQDYHATQLKATPHPDIHSQHAEAIDVQCDQDPGGHNEVERVNEHKALMHKTDAIMHNCKICKKSFKNERIYKAHNKSNHLNLPCSMCDKKFGSRRALNNHNKKKHKNPTIDPPNFKYSDH